MDAKKLHRCLEDVKINTAVARKLELERQKLIDNCGLDFTEALTMNFSFIRNKHLLMTGTNDGW